MTKVLAAIGLLTLLGGLGMCMYGMGLMHAGFSTRTPPSRLEATVARAARGFAVSEGERTMVNPVAATPTVLAAARAHWADHCASCHANDGSGQTEMGKLMYPRPPDMRLAGTQGLTDGALYAVIKNGIRLTGMPAWGEPGNADLESWKLVAFIRQLPLLTPADLREMAKMNPVSPMEQHEATAEEEFLNGGDEFPEDAGRAAH